MVTLTQNHMEIVRKAVKKGLITMKEWETRFIHYRDGVGYSFVTYLARVMSKEAEGPFITENPIMLMHNEEFKKRFGVEIMTFEDFYHTHLTDEQRKEFNKDPLKWLEKNSQRPRHLKNELEEAEKKHRGNHVAS